MFQALFQFLRSGIREAILGGFDDAQEEITRRIESARPAVLIDASPEPETNGKPKAKRSTARV